MTFKSSSNDHIVLRDLYYSFDRTHKDDGKETFLSTKSTLKTSTTLHEFELWHLVTTQVNDIVCCELHLRQPQD